LVLYKVLKKEKKPHEKSVIRKEKFTFVIGLIPRQIKAGQIFQKRKP
jgi:hypothetical protein